MGNQWRFVSSPDFHIKGTIQSAELKIDWESFVQQGGTTVRQEREDGVGVGCLVRGGSTEVTSKPPF